MKILAIETSCDETAAAVIKDGTKIISNVVASSKDLHEKTGGIIPEVAAREQVKCIIPVINEAIKTPRGWPNGLPRGGGIETTIRENIDALAVTIGPGLIGSLLVGVETAKTIAFVTGKPIIPVNHIFAHIYANWLTDNKDSPGRSSLQDKRSATPSRWPNGLLEGEGKVPLFPAIALVVSGGHTELFLMSNYQRIKWLGGTRDDAAGEVFDKTARVLGLRFPGGPAVASEAAKFCNSHPELTDTVTLNSFQGPHGIPKQVRNDKKTVQHDIVKLPRPMMNEENFEFSFSGLKTAVLREINKLKTLNKLNDEMIQRLAYEIQESITDVLVKKTLDAAKKYKVKSILLGGGVAANKRLTDKFKLKIENFKLKINLHVPPPLLCTDNAAYIASFAYFHNKPIHWQKIQAQPDLEVEV
ncbi:tRNA (adenosine(37)-N6)-threonylcarbamoyltransferase complex transferase subunit TsaD [Candidatus Gottesmanbacteria bacterium]|nr:tRNA (adenosine(37)-N6)-threonylcarbamoyltransferase complex transferase subunit TsaD [Candidatus Gottesmanbacteria bacterium]